MVAVGDVLTYGVPGGSALPVGASLTGSATDASFLPGTNLPYQTSLASATAAVTVAGANTRPIQTTAGLSSVFGPVTCVHQADGDVATGVLSNVDSSIRFRDQPFTKVSGRAPVSPPLFSTRFLVRYAGQPIHPN